MNMGGSRQASTGGIRGYFEAQERRGTGHRAIAHIGTGGSSAPKVRKEDVQAELLLSGRKGAGFLALRRRCGADLHLRGHEGRRGDRDLAVPPRGGRVDIGTARWQPQGRPNPRGCPAPGVARGDRLLAQGGSHLPGQTSVHRPGVRAGERTRRRGLGLRVRARAETGLHRAHRARPLRSGRLGRNVRRRPGLGRQVRPGHPLGRELSRGEEGVNRDQIDNLAGAMRRAGEAVRQLRNHSLLYAEAKTSPQDIVTRGDRASEEILVAAIRRHFPEDGILGEEGASVGGARTWFLDPIDGTANYAGGSDYWGISAGTVKEFGMICLPDTQTPWFWVEEDGSAWMGGDGFADRLFPARE